MILLALLYRYAKSLVVDEAELEISSAMNFIIILRLMHTVNPLTNAAAGNISETDRIETNGIPLKKKEHATPISDVISKPKKINDGIACSPEIIFLLSWCFSWNPPF